MAEHALPVGVPGGIQHSRKAGRPGTGVGRGPLVQLAVSPLCCFSTTAPRVAQRKAERTCVVALGPIDRHRPSCPECIPGNDDEALVINDTCQSLATDPSLGSPCRTQVEQLGSNHRPYPGQKMQPVDFPGKREEHGNFKSSDERESMLA